MNAIVRPVLTGEDVFVPNENEVLHTRGILEHDAIQQPETGEEPRKSSETEPHGMYWHREKSGVLVLKPHNWFLADVGKTAEAVLAKAIQKYNDKETQGCIRDMADALRSYVECRKAINDMAGARKLKGEADDACYQLAQAAKYFIDANETAKNCIERGRTVDGNKRVKDLKERLEIAMREGYMIAQAVILAAPTPPVFDLKLASKRVVEYSCRRLTDWFAAERTNEANAASNSEASAILELEKLLSL